MVVVLTVIWVLLWGAVTPTIVVGGVLAALLVVTVFPFPTAPWTWVVRPWPTLVLTARFLWDLVRASVEVSWFAVRPSGPPPSALLRIDLRSRSELLMTITSELVCLVPGSLLVELDSEEGAIYLHVMSAATGEDIEAFRQSVLEQERRVVRAFAPRAERDAVCSGVRA
jgi:multicomponent Na+:H+ antiporter subunit E